MKRTWALTLILALLLTAVASSVLVNLTSANFMPPIPDLPHIYIRGDGTVEPSSAPIQHVGDTYTLTKNLILENVIEVQRDNIIIDGGDHTIQVMAPSGIILLGRSNITIKNFNVKTFNSGISVRYSYNINISASTFSGNDIGVVLDYAVNNTIIENVMTENSQGILTYHDCDYNRIVRNQLTNNKIGGIWFESGAQSCDFNSVVQNTISSNIQEGIMCRSANNSIFAANTITDNGYGNAATVKGYGIFLSSSNNTFFCNNFANNYMQVRNLGKNNSWDNGVEGNYWSNYNGVDTDSDGIGDSPFPIDTNAQDNYPLMQPVDILAVNLPALPIASTITIPPPEPTPSPALNPSPAITPIPKPESSPTEPPNQTPPPQSEPPKLEDKTETPTNSNTESFPIILIAAVFGASLAVIGVGLLVYLKKYYRGYNK